MIYTLEHWRVVQQGNPEQWEAYHALKHEDNAAHKIHFFRFKGDETCSKKVYSLIIVHFGQTLCLMYKLYRRKARFDN